MRGGSKTLVALVALLLLAGLPGCGGGDDSDSTAAQGGAGGSAESGSGAGDSEQDGASGKSSSGGEAGSGEAQPAPDAGDASDFKPKPHDDSGGGAEQFKVKGGDNSVQEFGEEAGGSEFEAAATALHNFLDARAEGNWAAVCQYLSRSTIGSLEQLASRVTHSQDTSCAGTLASITNPDGRAALKVEAEQADVGSLRTEGEQAFLIYTAVGDTILAMPMANEGGAWKVASLAGTPLN